MKTFQACASYLTTAVIYLIVCVCCGVLAQSVTVFGISQTSFSLSSQESSGMIGTSPHAKERTQEEYEDYWRCPSCGGLVNPELDTCGCGFNK